MSITAAELRVGEESWEFDDTEWWIVRRYWVVHGSQSSEMGRLFGTGGAFDLEGIETLSLFFRGLRDYGSEPLIVGTDKYSTISDWHARWRQLLQSCGVAFESHHKKRVAVFRGKVNLTSKDPAARPDPHEQLPPFASAVTKAMAAVDRAMNVGTLKVLLATTYESL